MGATVRAGVGTGEGLVHPSSSVSAPQVLHEGSHLDDGSGAPQSSPPVLIKSPLLDDSNEAVRQLGAAGDGDRDRDSYPQGHMSSNDLSLPLAESMEPTLSGVELGMGSASPHPPPLPVVDKSPSSSPASQSPPLSERPDQKYAPRQEQSAPGLGRRLAGDLGERLLSVSPQP
ncbi:unnamed protein product, partial [Discosporangium mesarthrocarpum]